jgi:hypothetical protein
MLAIRVVDPIEWYMRQGDGEAPAPLRGGPRRAHTYGPWSETSPLPPPGEDVREQRRGEARLREHLARQDSLLRNYGPLFEDTTRELLDGREVTIPTTGGMVWARLIRFRNGAVLETTHVSPTGRGNGMSRIERRHLSDPVPIVSVYLANAILHLRLDARPIT